MSAERGREPSQEIRTIPPGSELEEFTRRYTAGETPWDTGVPNGELLRAVDAGELPGSTVLELGCGTGTNAVELARRGYKVTAIDLVELAVEKARERARRAGVDVDFRVGDLTRLDLGGPYDVVLDLGVYHGMRQSNLAGLLAAVERVSRPGTRWLSLAGNAKEPHPNGPPVVTEEEIRRELGAHFRIVRLRETRFDLAPGFQPLAWSILRERR